MVKERDVRGSSLYLAVRAPGCLFRDSICAKMSSVGVRGKQDCLFVKKDG